MAETPDSPDDGEGGTRGRIRPPTIYDVARAAGVAASTVSRAFSRPGRVNAETADRIRTIAAELGYRTNYLARALPTGRTSMLALVTSDVTNPFYAEIIRGAEAAAAEEDYSILLIDAQEDDRIERRNIERAVPSVEGIVLASTRMSDSAIRVIAKQRPTVVLNRDIADVSSIVTDNPHGARLAVDHLAGLGHRTVAYLAGPESSWVDGMRWRGLREAAATGLRIQRSGPVPPTVAGGAQAVEEILRGGAGAVVAYNDQVAIGLMRGLQAAGVRVPDDISVIGFDDIFVSDLVQPGLTTVAAPLRAEGHIAVRDVLRLINGAAVRGDQPKTLPVKLITRHSTAPPRGSRRKKG
ncbi:LacI family transcriptional regulator [Streptomyces sp. 3330]|uniref:LacI family DNA-binding transcriptional regulator n=1 Tax=Streptomyces sp. 3330 TaxID=2817755 RepID=UPI002865316F|nr:LacI family DNA-binding transcriptional regulator [Streptomyces sp. 3330]MDR6979643.1 LacI family transcriptional regulator [Streptomyces sp. 3330]